MDGAFWAGRRVLVTGHTGFKGGWLVRWLHALGADVSGIALPPASSTCGVTDLYAAADIERCCASRFVDLRDADETAAAVRDAAPELVFHLAAQPLVRASYASAAATWSTNVMGTIHLLDALRSVDGFRAVVVVTSDKCYANDGIARRFREDDALGGHDPYSSSKGGCEIAVASWRASFFAPMGIGVATARAGNVIGGGDWADDRLIPDLVRSALTKRPVTIRSPDAVRPWQHVLDPLRGYLMLAERLVADPVTHARAWNFGPDTRDAVTVGAVADRFVRAFGRDASTHVSRDARLHEAATLALDSARARRMLGWRPRYAIDDAIAMTADEYAACVDGGDVAACIDDRIAHEAQAALDPEVVS